MTTPTPSGPGIVHACTSTGLLGALNMYTSITFACTSGVVDQATGKYIIDLGNYFEVPTGEVLSIDGSDGGRNDIAISGGATVDGGAICASSITGHPLFHVDFGASSP